MYKKPSGQDGGNLRIEPSVDGRESSVGQYSRSDLRETSPGDVWVGGANAWGISGYTIGTPVLNSCLNIANNGVITIPYNLRTAGINVDTTKALNLNYRSFDDNVIIAGDFNFTSSWDSVSGCIKLVDNTAKYIVCENVGIAAPSVYNQIHRN